MSNLPNSLVEQAKKYSSLDDATKLVLLKQLYQDHSLSWGAVAKLCGTYSNKVRRDATKLGIGSRSKSDAQSAALESGRHGHPTKDKGHSEAAKVRISEGVADNWANMTDDEREAVRQDARRRWNQKSEEEIRQFREAAGEGVRLAAKEGSALEKYLLERLISAGYVVEFHKEYWAHKERLQIDLWLPEFSVAIEVDGPSHFEDIWGQDNLRKNQERDSQKTGLLLERGCVIIRVRQTQALSEKYKRDILARVLATLEQIADKTPSRGQRHIILGE